MCVKVRANVSGQLFSALFSLFAICRDSIKGGNNAWKENKTWTSMAIHNTKLACLEWPFSFLEMEFYYDPVTNANFFLAWAALSLGFPSRSVTLPQKFAARGRGCIIRPELLNYKEQPPLSSPQFYFSLHSIRNNGDAKKRQEEGAGWAKGQEEESWRAERPGRRDERRKAILKERRIRMYF